MQHGEAPPVVLILGAGVNGACVARELAINGVGVVIVDRHDIATGATAKSSRLIHGGLRYLEYGDVGLVRESLNERARLLRLAPQYVRPLRLHIPVARRTGGLIQAAFRFFKLNRIAASFPFKAGRGLWAVRIGLWIYDYLADSDADVRYRVHRVGEAGLPAVNSNQYRWLCSYSDAQILSPERFVLSLLDDARRAARERGVRFDVRTYHTAAIRSGQVWISPVEGDGEDETLYPATIVNATGAGGDRTLQSLGVDAGRLFGGTKGSHLFTSHPGLRKALGDDGVYAETADGRLVFVLPCGESVMIGTTDVRVEIDPLEVTASDQEIAYLLQMVDAVFPGVGVGPHDVTAHYCGVRPLPYVSTGKTGAIPRGHAIVHGSAASIPIDTLVGGKLTTCRQFGEVAADQILTRLGVPRTATTRDRVIPGGEDYPANDGQLAARLQSAADRAGWSIHQAAAVWDLIGSRLGQLAEEFACGSGETIKGTTIPQSFVDWSIQNEAPQHLEDLIERRLMLAWSRDLSLETLRDVAARMVAAGRLPESQLAAEIDRSRRRLEHFYGRRFGD
mgnify:FL=1